MQATAAAARRTHNVAVSAIVVFAIIRSAGVQAQAVAELAVAEDRATAVLVALDDPSGICHLIGAAGAQPHLQRLAAAQSTNVGNALHWTQEAKRVRDNHKALRRFVIP